MSEIEVLDFNERYSVELMAERELTARLSAEIAQLREAASKGTEYVLAQINEDLRAEILSMKQNARAEIASRIHAGMVSGGAWTDRPHAVAKIAVEHADALLHHLGPT